MIFSRCQLGKERWYWAVWLDFEMLCDQQPIEAGHARSSIDAEAIVATKYPDARKYQNYFASGEYKRQLKANRKSNENATGAKPVEYLYTDWSSDFDDSGGSMPHQITKKTKKRVFVLRDDWCGAEECYSLDRQRLETDGYDYAQGKWWRCYYTTPWEERHRRIDPSVDRRELRQKLAAAHPDHGGDPVEFKRLREQYESTVTH